MIIYLDASREDFATVEKNVLEERISSLLRSHKYGNNLIIISRKTADWILSDVEMIASDETVLRRISQEVTQTGDLLRRAKVYIKISRPSERFGEIGGGIVQLPTDNRHFDQIIKPPVFIVEDIVSDKEIYYFIFKQLVGRGIPFVFPVEPPVHGGGERIGHVSRERIEEKRIVYTIADSDKRYPAAYSPKGEMLRRICEEVQWPLFFYGVTPGQELENVLSVDIIRHIEMTEASGTLGAMKKIEDEEKRAFCSPGEYWWLFFDTKKGLSREDFSRITDRVAKDWIGNKLLMCGIRNQEFHLVGFGDKLASKIMKNNSSLAEFARLVRSDEWLAVFGDFFEKIMWVLMASQRQRT